MIITEQVLRSGEGYPLDHVNNEYEVSEGVRFRLRKTTYGLARRVDTMPNDGGLDNTIAMCRVICSPPDGWDWDDISDDVVPGMFARMVADFLLPAAGLYYRPRNG